MTLSEAIEFLNALTEGFPVNDVEKYYRAMELGSEALKRCKAYKEAHKAGLHYVPLPGETEE